MIQAEPGDIGAAGVKEEVERMRSGTQKVHKRHSIGGPSGHEDFKADARPPSLCGYLS